MREAAIGGVSIALPKRASWRSTPLPGITSVEEQIRTLSALLHPCTYAGTAAKFAQEDRTWASKFHCGGPAFACFVVVP